MTRANRGVGMRSCDVQPADQTARSSVVRDPLEQGGHALVLMSNEISVPDEELLPAHTKVSFTAISPVQGPRACTVPGPVQHFRIAIAGGRGQYATTT